jgi:flavin reductase (DIM6/NTAB) family NADH-FMN oxidoreductase RutF
MSIKKVSSQKALDIFHPQICAFVISVGKHGKPSGMVASWNMRCSSDPSLFAVALSKKGYTHKLIQQSKEFVIAVPNKELEKEVEFFGSTHGNKVDKFKKTGLETIKAKYLRTPLIKEATINLECKLAKEVDLGNNIIFIGKVLAAYINPKRKKILLNMGIIKGKRIFKEC